MLKAGELTDAAVAERTLTGEIVKEGLEDLLRTVQLDELRKSGAGPRSFVTVRVNDPDPIKDLKAANENFAGAIKSHRIQVMTLAPEIERGYLVRPGAPLDETPHRTAELDQMKHRSGDIRHVRIEGLGQGAIYA